MKRRRLVIAGAAGGFLVLGFVVSSLLSNQGQYDRLLRARRAEAQFTRWRTTKPYQFVSRLTGFDAVGYYERKADQLEQSLVKSGDLVSLMFYAPNQSAGTSPVYMLVSQRSQVSPVYWRVSQRSQVAITLGQGIPVYYGPWIEPSPHGGRYARCIFYYDDLLTMLCRAEDVPLWQARFCYMTNRVRWGALRKLAGNRETDSCLLPNNTLVDLNEGQKWLNDSIVEGWKVGVMPQGSRIVALRRKSNNEVQVADSSKIDPRETVRPRTRSANPSSHSPK